MNTLVERRSVDETLNAVKQITRHKSTSFATHIGHAEGDLDVLGSCLEVFRVQLPTVNILLLSINPKTNVISFICSTYGDDIKIDDWVNFTTGDAAKNVIEKSSEPAKTVLTIPTNDNSTTISSLLNAANDFLSSNK